MDRSILIAAIEASSDGILISDEKGNVVYTNNAYEVTTGLKKEEIIGESLKTLLDQKIINDAVSLSVIQDEKPKSIMHKYITGKSALTTASPIFDKEHKLIGVVNNTRNISELINLRNELIKTKELTMKYSQEIKRLRQLTVELGDFICASEEMKRTIKLASKVAEFDSTVLIHGESGTGKEVLAKFIHTASPRKDEPFIKVNCAAIPKELFESELFGYNEGSFTGASKGGKPGMFELANKGSILLDEIGELPLLVQSKLLRVIQEREVCRVGGKLPIKLDVRIIAATNRDLKHEVAEGRFRGDLYFRLNVIPIIIPPLRERKGDIEELALFFLEKLNRKYKKTITINSDAMEALSMYSWPGNVRELENLIEYLFIMKQGEEINIDDLPSQIITERLMSQTTLEKISSPSKLIYMTELYEKSIIQRTLSNFASVRQTASALGIHASTLCRKIKKYNINLECME